MIVSFIGGILLLAVAGFLALLGSFWIIRLIMAALNKITASQQSVLSMMVFSSMCTSAAIGLIMIATQLL